MKPTRHRLPSTLGMCWHRLSLTAIGLWGAIAIGLMGAATRRAPEAPATVAQWEARVEQAVDAGREQWSVLIEELRTGRPIYAYNPEMPLTPASNRKLVVFALALETLGADYRFATEFGLDAPLEEGRAHYHGNLILRASGDPTFEPPFVSDSDGALAWFRECAQALRQRGVAYVHGDLVVDATVFGADQDAYPSAWDPSHRNYAYGAIPSALAIHGNVLRIVVAPGARAGRAPTVSVFPSPTGLAIVNSVQTAGSGTAGVSASYDETDRQITLSGRVLAGRGSETVLVPLRCPIDYACANLRQALNDAGITLAGRTIVLKQRPPVDPHPPLHTVLTTRQSPPLTDILRVMLRTSDNFIAEQLWRSAAARVTSVGDVATAREVEARWLRTRLQRADVRAGWDGAGLSRWNEASAREMTALLRYLERSPYRGVLLDCLPVAGQSGTLRGRPIVDAPGRVVAKTGSMSGVSALSGFIRDRSGQERYVFSVIGNAPSETNGLLTQRIDQLLRLIIRDLDAAP